MYIFLFYRNESLSYCFRGCNRHIIKPHKSVYVFLIFLSNLIDICYTNYNTTVELKVVNHSTSFLVQLIV